ncbi:MAG: tetratricopeptide repeat protein [Myxococcota bacterium]|nr:tetratricopeptide repeat protein [Myxococcota bacterium]
MKVMRFTVPPVGLVLMLCLPFSGLAEKSKTQSDDYPKHPLTTKAKDAYNSGKYNEAVRSFRRLAILFPENPTVYRGLARALSWANEPAYALQAYWHYQDLAPSASDQEKVKAEIELLLRRVKKPPSRHPSSKIKAAFQAIEVRAKSGRFTGRDGALGALEQIISSQYFGPKIGHARRQIRKQLMVHSDRASTNWWQVTTRAQPKTLVELTSAWELLDIETLTDVERTTFLTLDAMTHLSHGEAREAAKIIAPVAAGRPRVRYLQAVALVRSKQYQKAYALLSGLARGSVDSRIHILLGFAAQKLGKKAASESFLNALNTEDEP